MTRLIPLAVLASALIAGGAVVAFVPRGDAGAITNCDTGAAWIMLQEERQFLDMLNQARAAAGLQQLHASPSLSAAAAWKSIDQADHPDNFSHVDSLGRPPDVRIRDCGYPGATIGENIAMGMLEPDQAFHAFQLSPMHCANMMNPGWRAAGVGFHRGQWTITFGALDDSGEPPFPPPGEPSGPHLCQTTDLPTPASPTAPGSTPTEEAPAPTPTPEATDEPDEDLQPLQFDRRKAIAPNLVVSN